MGTANVATQITAADYRRVLVLLEGTNLTPVRWFSLIARARIASGEPFDKEHVVSVRDRRSVRLVATVDELGKARLSGRLTEAQWGRAVILDALERGLVPEDRMIRWQSTRGGMGTRHVARQRVPS